MININFLYTLFRGDPARFIGFATFIINVFFWSLFIAPALLLVVFAVLLVCFCLFFIYVYFYWIRHGSKISSTMWYHMMRTNSVLYGGAFCAHSWTAELLELTLCAVKGTIFLCGVTLFVGAGILLGAPASLLINNVSSFKEMPDTVLCGLVQELSPAKLGSYYDTLDQVLRPYFTPARGVTGECCVRGSALADAPLRFDPSAAPPGKEQVLSSPAKSEETIDDKLWWAALAVIVGACGCVAASYWTK